MIRPRQLLGATGEVLTSVLYQRHSVERALRRHFRDHPELGARDRAQLWDTVFGCLRHVRSLDYLLAGPRDPLQGWRSPREAALHTALWQIRARGWGAAELEAAGLEPEAIETIGRCAACDLRTAPPPVRADLPDWLYQRLAERLAETEVLALARALGEPAPVDLRVNTLKTTRDRLACRLRDDGVLTQPTPFSPVGLRLEAHVPLADTIAHRDGELEIQDEGSQLIAPLVEPRRGEMVVDYCAGAGGKTLHLAALMANTGSLQAFDTSLKRLQHLTQRARRAGVTNLRVTHIESPSARAVQALRGKADRVLVDAPCSGTGTVRRSPEIPWQPHDLAGLALAQQQILEAASSLARPGGRVVYATCSLLREENDTVVEAFLARRPEFRALPVAPILARRRIALTVDGEATLLRLCPHHHGTDAFFAVVLERRTPGK